MEGVKAKYVLQNSSEPTNDLDIIWKNIKGSLRTDISNCTDKTELLNELDGLTISHLIRTQR